MQSVIILILGITTIIFYLLTMKSIFDMFKLMRDRIELMDKRIKAINQELDLDILWKKAHMKEGHNKEDSNSFGC